MVLFDLPDSTVNNPVTFNVTVSGDGYPYWTSSFEFRASKLATAIENTVALLPEEFALFQNYPNPFNPATTIKFTLPKSVYATLKVFNILGREVSTLVLDKLNQGEHVYTFNGNNLASGIYYYQLVAGDYREVKKMILLR